MSIEMRLRCYLIIGNLQFVIGKRQLPIGHWQKATETRQLVIGQSKVSVLSLDRLEFLDRVECLNRIIGVLTV